MVPERSKAFLVTPDVCFMHRMFYTILKRRHIIFLCLLILTTRYLLQVQKVHADLLHHRNIYAMDLILQYLLMTLLMLTDIGKFICIILRKAAEIALPVSLIRSII